MLAMLRPVMPVMEYYANYDYIVNVLCENKDEPVLECNGKCYLKKEMKKVSQPISNKNEQQDSSIPQIDFTKYPVAPIVENNHSIQTIKNILQKNWNTSIGKPIDKVNTVFRPPLFV